MARRPSQKLDAKLACNDLAAQVARLRRWIDSPTTQQRVVRRSRIVLMALAGVGVTEISARAGVSAPTVRLWIKRFEEAGAEALLHDAAGRGRHVLIDSATMRARLQSANLLGPDGRPISLRTAGAFLRVSASSVRRAFQKSA
jgi:AcrR family transcriptional regulator